MGVRWGDYTAGKRKKKDMSDYYTKYNHLRIMTEDYVELGFGDVAYNYYDMKPGKIGRIHEPYTRDDNETNIQTDIWFDFEHDEGGTAMLNGARICTIAFARRRGFRDA